MRYCWKSSPIPESGPLFGVDERPGARLGSGYVNVGLPARWVAQPTRLKMRGFLETLMNLNSSVHDFLVNS